MCLPSRAEAELPCLQCSLSRSFISQFRLFDYLTFKPLFILKTLFFFFLSLPLEVLSLVSSWYMLTTFSNCRLLNRLLMSPELDGVAFGAIVKRTGKCWTYRMYRNRVYCHLQGEGHCSGYSAMRYICSGTFPSPIESSFINVEYQNTMVCEVVPIPSKMHFTSLGE